MSDKLYIIKNITLATLKHENFQRTQGVDHETERILILVLLLVEVLKQLTAISSS